MCNLAMKYLTMSALLHWSVLKGVIIRENNPAFCRCGNARRGEKITPRDIQDMVEITTTTTTTTTKDIGQRSFSVRAIDNHNKLPQYYNLKDQKEIKEKYFPYVPTMRPWLVIIDVNMTDEEKNTECTGSILAPRWVITSRSCICGDRYGCNLLSLKAEQGLKIFVHHDFHYEKPSYKDERPILATNIHVHGKNFTHTDVALLELKHKFDFNSGIMPICLPQPPYDKDEERDAWISGYNFHFKRKVPQWKKCRTTGGPNKYNFCKFPFKQRSGNQTADFTSCVTNQIPSHLECEQLQRFMNWTEKVPKGMHKVLIRKDVSQDPNKEENYPGLLEDFVELECHKAIGMSDWCGTCLHSATKGQPGYCGEDAATTEETGRFEREKPRPSAWGGWGFCDPLCRQLGYRGFRFNKPTLNEIMRKISSHEDCRKHLGKDGLVTRLCLYQEQEVDVQATYRMVSPTQFEPELEDGPKRYGPTAIQPSVGDAGAPVFTFIDNAEAGLPEGGSSLSHGISYAVLLGVLSTNQFQSQNQDTFARSDQREQMSDQVVSRIVPILKWIKMHIQKDHYCGPKA